MDGIESSRRLHEALPPDEAPIVVALSADTLQVRRSAPGGALAPASCCAMPYALPRSACLLELSNAGRSDGAVAYSVTLHLTPASADLALFSFFPPPCCSAAQMQDTKCAAAGFSAFICKPFRVEDVQRVLRLVQQ